MIVIWGKLVGALLGLPIGPLGVAFGFLIGTLVDQALRSALIKKHVEHFLSGRPAATEGGFDKVVAAALGLGMAVASLECLPTVRQVALLREQVARYFRLGRRQAEIAQQIIDEAYRIGAGLDIYGLAELLRGSTSLLEREELMRIYTQVAELDRVGITAKKRSVLKTVAARLKIRKSAFLEMIPEAQALDAESCRLLGVPRDTDIQEVKRVYRRLAQQFHPDAVVDLTDAQRRQAAAAFLRIKSAYDILTAQLGRPDNS